MIYFTSDTHFGHGRILCFNYHTRYRFLTPTDNALAQDCLRSGNLRNFKASEESINAMDASLIENINARIAPDDTLWHLGDFSFYDGKKLREIFDAIKCKDIRICFGNHDWQSDLYKSCRFSQHHTSVTLYEFPDDPGKCHTEHEVFASKALRRQLDKNYKSTKKIYLSHYCSLVWPINRSSIHLYGHSHGELVHPSMHTPSMDVGVDSSEIFVPLSPISLDEVWKIMNYRHAKWKGVYDASNPRIPPGFPEVTATT